MRTSPSAAMFPSIVAIVLCLGKFLSAAEPQTVTLKDWTGRGFPPDLVTYAIPAQADGGRNLRVLDAAGQSLPVQFTPGDKGKALRPDSGQATLSFVTALPPNGTAVFTVRADGPSTSSGQAKAAVSATKDGDALVLANQFLAVKVPAPMDKTYDKPVAADTLPAPLLAFRGPDGSPSTGLGAGWRGSGSIVHQQPVKAIRIEKIADGPVFTEVHYRLDYAGGGYYAATIRVTDRAPFAQVTEEYDLGATTNTVNTHFWQLDLSKGWKPDAAEHMFVAGQGYGEVKYPSLAEEEKVATTGPQVGQNEFGHGPDAPTRCIHHDSCWGSRYVSYYGIYRKDERQAGSNNYPLAMVAPLHKGSWRRANSLPVYVKGGQVRVCFPMDVVPLAWQNEPASDTSPFSCHEHDPNLPTTYGRRVWALVLAQPTLRVAGYGNPNTAGIGYSVRMLYGQVGLDRYKDFVLSWPFDSAQGGPDTKVVYPCVFITPEGVKQYREAVKADPSFPLLTMVKDYYWFTGEPETAKKELPDVHKQLQHNIDDIVTSLSSQHHQTLGEYGTPIGHTESVLSWPDLPTADREAIRARLALLTYLLVEPDVTSAGDGSHHGNPNMGVSRLSDRSNLMAMLPDHPMHKAWRDYMGMFTAYKTGTFMAPEGAWIEYGASYHMHGYGKILRGLMGLLSSDAPQADRMWAYNRADFEYYLNLLSPFDSRYGARTIPGTANAPVGNPPHFIQAMGTVADRDPAFAANLRWAWDESGRMIGTGGDGITVPAMIRPSIAAQEPKLDSRLYPGFGVIFRAHQGADETALYLRSGYMWSHWGDDQGKIMLYAKGAVLLPCQPYQYRTGARKDKNFADKNFLRFGAPANEMPYAWPDSNILDAHFSPSVDYAWSSTGYPDWFIKPGFKKGWGDPRELVAGLNQKEGAFAWDRQIVFLKGATGKSPNYFVIRDSQAGDPSAGSGQGGKLASWFNLSLLGHTQNVQVAGSKVAVDTEWPTKLDLLFPGRKALPFEMLEETLPLHLMAYNKFTGNPPTNDVISRDWLDEKTGKPLTVKDGSGLRWGWGGSGTVEQHVELRLQNAPGEEIAWIVYPRGVGETTPTATQLAPGVTKVVTAEGTDYVFLSTVPLAYEGEGVVFAGLAGAVRVAKDGKATLVLSAGPGKAGYKGSVVESAVPFERLVSAGKTIETIPAPKWGIAAPLQAVTVESNGVRFVAGERKYVELTRGNVGVRGVGPFDLTFTPDGIVGKVDGDIRTLVTTWPENVTRPGYTMDGVRWCAGFADEPSISKGMATPQFSVAFGVSAGPHEVKIDEWEWPALPPALPRAALQQL